MSALGWSYGAGGVLAALKAMPTDPPITKAVMYYPVCRGAAPWTTNTTGLMLLGAIDDIAYPALCDAVGDAAREAADDHVPQCSPRVRYARFAGAC